jgi:hypothetical protein
VNTSNSPLRAVDLSGNNSAPVLACIRLAAEIAERETQLKAINAELHELLKVPDKVERLTFVVRGYRVVKKLTARKAYTVKATSFWQLAICHSNVGAIVS